MIYLFTQWSIGFSLIAIAILWCVYWRVYEAFDKTCASKLACSAMLGSVGALQCWHGWVLENNANLFDSRAYLVLLHCSPIAFLCFCYTLIQPKLQWSYKYTVLLAPLFIGISLPAIASIPFAFVVGGLSAIWLLRRLYPLKEHRQHFALERFVLLGIALVALLILLVGLITPWLGERLYILAYANLTALVFIAILWLLLRYPDMMQKAVEAVSGAYVNSTLKNHDNQALEKRLKSLMIDKALYKEDDLNLNKLADALNLSPHQTSELVNTQFGMSVSRLIRHYRIEAAKKALILEPDASVLAIGLSVGFNSQSTFYTAFRALTGETPSQFRKHSKL